MLSPAAWAEQTGPGPSAILDQARAAIVAGRLDEAAGLLAQVDGMTADRNDLEFLRGTVALGRGDYDAAIDAFHRILDRDPSLNRVRLDLARVFFLKGDDEAAEHHFRIAEAAGLPPEVQANVDKFLAEIARRKRWGVTTSFGIAPDTNANSATASRTVSIYGLPFDLNDDARQHSGIGVVMNIGGTYQYDLAADSRLVVGADDSEVDYGSHRFDDRTTSVQAGPRFLVGDDTEVTVLGLADRRWYGEAPLNWGAGARVEAQQAVTPRLLASAALEGQQVTYVQAYDAFSGPRLSLSLSGTYGIDAVSSVRLDTAILREQTRVSADGDWQYIVGASYHRELPLGFSADLGTTVDLARYDRVMTGFGSTLHYDQVAWKVCLSNKHLTLWGFAPVVSYTHTDKFSNQSLYAYSRDQGEIAVTRTF